MQSISLQFLAHGRRGRRGGEYDALGDDELEPAVEKEQTRGFQGPRDVFDEMRQAKPD